MKKTKSYRSDFLFPKSTFLVGMGSIGNLFGCYFKYNTSATDVQADTRAISSTWGAVGIDIKNAMSKFVKSLS